MRQGCARGCRVRPIGLLLTLLMMPPLAAAEEAPFAVAVAGAKDAGHWPFALVGPLEEAPFAVAGASAKDAGHWPFALMAPLEEAPFAVAGAAAKDAGQWPYSLAAPRLAAGGEPRAAVGGAWQRPYAQTGSSEPSEEAPIPFEGAAPSPGARWPYALPFLADQVIKQGYTLPLPRGVSMVYTYVQRDIKISSVSLGVNGAPLRDVSNFVNLGSTSHVSVAVARFDAWLLPFLNAYAIAGYVSNNTTTRGIVTIPPLTERGDPRTFKLTKTTELGGFVGGVGLTAAAGWRDFFILADFNFSQTDIGFDNPFHALIGTVRSGWNGKVLDIPLRLWVGGSYWGTKGTAKATVEVPDVGSVTFSAVQGPLHPLNALVGGNVTLFRRWEAFFEYGFNFNDIQIVAAGLSFRF